MLFESIVKARTAKNSMNTQKQILIISFSHLKNDSRVYRHIEFLSQRYQTTAVGLEDPEIEGVEFFLIRKRPRSLPARIFRAVEYKLQWFEHIYWTLYDFEPLLEILSQQNFDVILANDIDTLPFAFKIAKGARVILDAHEYAPRHFEDQFIWRFFSQSFNQYLCETYLKRCHKVLTVTQEVGNEYKKEYGIEPLVITNAVRYVDIEPSRVDPENIRIISHGVANPGRKLELSIKMMDYVDSRFHFDLMLMPTNPRYLKRLQVLADQRKNVNLRQPVPQKDLIPVINFYDISLIIFQPNTINYRYGLGNKFFQSLQARLLIVTGPTPVPQAKLVAAYDCGVITESFEPENIAHSINTLTNEKIKFYKQRAAIAAKKLAAEKNLEKLAQIISDCI